MSTETTDAKGAAAKKGDGSKGFTVGVDADAHRQVTAQSKKLNVSKTQYASAAIAYFAESGLDPTKEQRLGFAGIAQKLDAVEAAIRNQNHEIGTRLVQIIRTWEKNLYSFLQLQQASTNNYLEMIESNILQHQVLIETNYFAPMVENLFKANLEAFIARGLTTELFVKAATLPSGSYEKQMELSNTGRDQQLVTLMREFLKTNSVPLPKPTRRPAVAPVPLPPPKPAAPASTAPTVAPKL